MYGSPGIGTIGHLGMERFNHQAGITMNHIPYKGTSQYLNDLIAGHIQIAITQLAGCLTYLKQGKLVAIGATAEKRSNLLPDVPLVAEQGLPTYSSYNWNGILAPKGTPNAIVQKIYEVLSIKMALKENQELFTSQGHEPGSLSPEGFRSFIQQDLTRNSELAKVANIHE
jgi:tripartite-type tricarboxylate transporter receptor subunit TctC